MAKSEIITKLENVILQWDETSVGYGDFNARTFLYRGKEFGHIHKNGYLDIVFAKEIVTKLLQNSLVQKHLYVPGTSVTYSISNEAKLLFAVSLLRFSYLISFSKFNANEPITQSVFESELAKLPETLSSIYLT